MIQLGLQRITKLLAQTPLTWRAIHVAGTNGKGSTCAYINSMLREYNKSDFFDLTGHKKLSYGRFTSPHLVDRWDGIRINDEVISRKDFLNIESHFKDYDTRNGIGASEFELLTATAFEAFNRAGVDIGVVEVGMGGRDDATNIIGQQELGGPARPKPLVTVVTNIALDHQGFLGDTIQEIAAHKAGIMKAGVPAVFATLDDGITDGYKAVLAEHALRCDAPVLNGDWISSLNPIGDSHFQGHLLRGQKTYGSGGANVSHLENAKLACTATISALEQLGRLFALREDSSTQYKERLAELLARMDILHRWTQFPGRCELVEMDVSSMPARGSSKQLLLLDGAHNAAAALSLKCHLRHVRSTNESRIIWVVAHSQGRPVGEFLKPLLEPGDGVITTEFGSVDGMPWVKSMPADEIVEQVRRLLGAGNHNQHACKQGPHEALLQAFRQAAPNQLIVVTGSLYLVGDVHRLIRDGVLKKVAKADNREKQSAYSDGPQEFVEPYSQG